MKIYILFLLIFFSLLLANCAKHKPNNNNDHVPGLPPATQIGANTFGCLVNGVPWVPQGFGGTTNNLSIDYDPGFNNGIFGISAYRKTALENTSIAIGIGDSMTLITAPYTFHIGFKNIGGSFYSDLTYCQRMSTDSLHFTKGFITIIKIDRVNKIIAGSFDCTLFNKKCGDTIKLTKGRFDFKF
jgi:hypothetical protein